MAHETNAQDAPTLDEPTLGFSDFLANGILGGNGDGPSTDEAPAPEPPKMAPDETEPEHPALYIGADRASVAVFLADKTITRVTYRYGERKIERETRVEDLTWDAGFSGRWPLADYQEFIAAGRVGVPRFYQPLGLISGSLDALIEFPRPEYATFVAVWSLATYFHPVFSTFPRAFLSGEKGSGKTKVEGVVKETAFNAIHSIRPTAPVLFRTIAAYRPTMLLDEIEYLGDRFEGDHGVAEVINAGYKKGAVVQRLSGDTSKDYRPISFAVYGPMMVAGINEVNATTRDRGISIRLYTGSDRQKINQEVIAANPLWRQIRAMAYRLMLFRSPIVATRWKTVRLPSFVNGRPRELWRPLFTIAALADDEMVGEGRQLTPDLEALARVHVAERDPVSRESEALLRALRAALRDQPEMITRPKDVADWLCGEGVDASPERAGELLRRVGFETIKRDKHSARYRVTRAHLETMWQRYGLDGEDEEGSRV